MTAKLLAEQNLEFLSLKAGAQTGLRLFISNCRIVGNLMSRLNCDRSRVFGTYRICVKSFFKHTYVNTGSAI